MFSEGRHSLIWREDDEDEEKQCEARELLRFEDPLPLTKTIRLEELTAIASYYLGVVFKIYAKQTDKGSLDRESISDLHLKLPDQTIELDGCSPLKASNLIQLTMLFIR